LAVLPLGPPALSEDVFRLTNALLVAPTSFVSVCVLPVVVTATSNVSTLTTEAIIRPSP
jgi:hypothetical protein